jgi:flagellar motor component MotA
MGVFWGTILIIIPIIRVEGVEIFVNINSLLIIVRGVLATGFINFPSDKPIGMLTTLRERF